MSPEDKKKQLKNKFKKKRESNKDKGFKYLSELGIYIDDETFKEWRKNR